MTNRLSVDSIHVDAHNGMPLTVGFCLDGDDHRHLSLTLAKEDHPRLRALWEELVEVVLPEAGALVCGLVVGTLTPDTIEDLSFRCYICQVSFEMGGRHDGAKHYCPEHA